MISGVTMKVDFNEVLLDDDAQPVLESAGTAEILKAMALAGVERAVSERVVKGLADHKALPDDSKEMTLGACVRAALRAPDRENRDRFDDRIELSIRIRQAGPGTCEISDDDEKLILGRVLAHFDQPIVHYRVKQALTVARAAAIDAQKANEVAIADIAGRRQNAA